MRQLMAAGLAVALAAALAGCNQADQAEVHQDVRGVRQEFNEAARNVRDAAAEATLASKVKTALGMRKGVSTRGINVEVNGTTVVLKGNVRTQEEAELVERVAMETEGVSAVQNELMLLVPARPTTSTAPSSVPAATPYPDPSGGTTGPGTSAPRGTGSGY